MYSCGSGIETAIHFFLHCANFNNQKQTLFSKTTFTDATILTEDEDSYLVNQVVKILLTEQF